MRVLVNQWLASGHKTGIGHYAAELLRALRAHAGQDEFLDYPPAWLRWLRGSGRGSSSGPAAPTRTSRDWQRSLGRRLLSAHFRTFCALRQFDIYHEPNYIPLPCDRPTVATIHDLSLLVHRQWHPAERVAWFEDNVPRMLNQCRHFLTDSDFSRREAMRVLGIRPERITRVYVGIRPHLVPLSPERVAEQLHHLGLPSRYLLYVGTIEPRKNLLVLLRAYCALPEALRSAWPLVLVGRWGWNAAAEADYLQQTAAPRGVMHLGYVPEQNLAALYNGARALVYPSLYEGFGLPPVEMIACGGAVLASTAGAVAEVVAGRGHLIDPQDEEGWRRALTRVLTDADWWQSLRSDVVGLAQSYSWDRCAAETLRVYQSLYSGQKPGVLRAA